VDWLLNRPGLLRLVSRFAVETRPEDLGEMTVSVLRGIEGRQAKELGKLVRFLRQQAPPDVVNLSNSLLSAIAPAVRDALDVPVVCSLQGEEDFIGRLPGDEREEAIKLVRENAASIDLFIAGYASYADEMSDFLRVPRTDIRVVRPGVDVTAYAGDVVHDPGVFRIGYLSRITPAKGLDVLAEAFCAMDRRPTGQKNTLAVAGQLARPDRRFWRDVEARVAEAGLGEALEYSGKLDFEGKVRFLKGCSVFCVPSRYAQRSAMAWIEAMAAGVPIVAPDNAGFRELVQITGGGVLVEPDSPDALAAELTRLRDAPQERTRLAAAAREGVEREFAIEVAVQRTEEVYSDVIHAGGSASR
jgi:glycosyltransferase involved in cell wall biosynthesis